MKKKQILVAILALAMTMGLMAGCSSSQSGSTSGAAGTSTATPEPTAEDAVTLRLAWTVAYDEGHPYTVAAESFKQYVEENTDGRIKVELYPGSQLGGDNDMFDMLQMGTLDVAVLSSPVIANYTRVMVGCDMPYVCEGNYDVLKAVQSGETGRYLLDRLEEECNVVGLSFIYQPFRYFFTNNKIESVDDFQGVKIRCMESDIHQEIFNTLGFSAVTMPYSEVYSACQNGTINGFESDTIGAVTSSFYEVTKYLTLSGHFNNSIVLLMAPATYEKLSAADQEIMMKASEYAADQSFECTVNRDDECRDLLLNEYGMELCEIDMQAVYDACNEMVEKYCAEIPEVKYYVESVEKIKAEMGV